MVLFIRFICLVLYAYQRNERIHSDKPQMLSRKIWRFKSTRMFSKRKIRKYPLGFLLRTMHLLPPTHPTIQKIPHNESRRRRRRREQKKIGLKRYICCTLLKQPGQHLKCTHITRLISLLSFIEASGTVKNFYHVS